MKIDPGSEYWRGFIGLLIFGAIVISIAGMLFASGRLNREWLAQHGFQTTAIMVLLVLVIIQIFRMVKR